jgi:hypothetical protein
MRRHRRGTRQPRGEHHGSKQPSYAGCGGHRGVCIGGGITLHLPRSVIVHRPDMDQTGHQQHEENGHV